MATARLRRRTPTRALSPREREVARLIGAGLTNREIGARLVVDVRTVDAHVRHIFGKLGLTRRAELVALAATAATFGVDALFDGETSR